MDRVRIQNFVGSQESETYLYRIVRDGNGILYFSGYVNKRFYIGRLSNAGAIVWTAATSTAARHLTAAALSNGGVIVAGKEPEISYYAADGATVNELDLDDSGGDVWFNATATVAAEGQTVSLVAVGGKRVDDIMHPYLAVLGLSETGGFVTREDTTFLDFPNSVFRYVVVDTSAAPMYIVVHNTFSGSGEYVFGSVRALSDSYSTTWVNDLNDISGQTQTATEICKADDGVAVVGRRLVRKGDGQDWWATMARFIELDGSVRWTISPANTQYDDEYWSCSVVGDELVAAGQLSSFSWANTKRLYGFGLLSRIDLSTGQLNSNVILGDPACTSQINGVTTYQETACIVGFTQYYIIGGSGRGWYLEVDLSDPAPGPGVSEFSDLLSLDDDGAKQPFSSFNDSPR